ncbi:acetyl-CoA C-acetyltransferase [Frischella perrara]|uniref:Acetyl-CoA acetyltransferase n=1 Tax=Frischella perrara TaxID=1267021 RepID=A0A0A7RYZ7_FRIPE|nr:acetyl-CoA C-acetyltransferase [Frischella perrara]AJA44438.1 acetyl-CoA acetyltransferase [Frischella perrara]PWV60942.1 acetyl-CoA C-acetyltransferase [Frischella perrara]
MEEIVIVAAKRTAIGGFLGAFSELSATELGAMLIKYMLDESNIPVDEIDQVIMGQVLTAGCGQNPARQTALKAGLPERVTGLTVNKVCGSGLVAINLAVQAIRNGDAQMIIAGGQESMSTAAHVLKKGRKGNRLGHLELVDTLLYDGLTDAFNQYHMGITAENIAEEFNISREEQDSFALSSQNKALKAIQNSAFSSEIMPIKLTTKKGEIVIDKDESPRETSFNKLSTLQPVFKKDGVVTAGNSSPINDGAAAVIICSKSRAISLGLKPLVSITAFANTGINPAMMGLGSISAIQACLEKTGQSINDIDLFECNEAFASQAIATQKTLNLPDEKLNVNGGAIALGHPIGASGCRILVSLIYQLFSKKLSTGIAALCVGGGEGVAMSIIRN